MMTADRPKQSAAVSPTAETNSPAAPAAPPAPTAPATAPQTSPQSAATTTPPFDRINLHGFGLDVITLAQATDHIVASARAGRGGWVITPNLDILRRLSREPEFAALASQTTLRLADGMPLVWASRLQRTPLPERVAGSDLIWTLSERGAAAGLRFYLLGGNPGAAQAAADTLTARFPGFAVAGIECPPMGFERDSIYMDALRTRLAAAAPDVVLVALGAPKQERVIAAVRDGLPAAWFLGIGISFSFVAGDVQRAPAWMRRTGLEWVHRLVQEPGRLARRYLIDGIPFAISLLVRSALHGLRPGAAADRRPGSSS